MAKHLDEGKIVGTALMDLSKDWINCYWIG